jgi:cytidyltransferase-like protein
MKDRNVYFFSLEDLAGKTEELHSAGKIIGLTHGAFDLFHIAHLDLFEQASELCDYLIVGVDSDEAVKEYKGLERPIIPQVDRVKIV